MNCSFFIKYETLRYKNNELLFLVYTLDVVVCADGKAKHTDALHGEGVGGEPGVPHVGYQPPHLVGGGPSLHQFEGLIHVLVGQEGQSHAAPDVVVG